MDSKLSIALERRLKSLPNKATIGLQANIQENPADYREYKKNDLNSTFSVSVNITENNKFRDQKVGTDYFFKDQSHAPKTKKTPLALKYRLKGVMAEENNEITQIDEINKILKIKLEKEKKTLLDKM